jgi:predicted small lipoprotein YifL
MQTTTKIFRWLVLIAPLTLASCNQLGPVLPPAGVNTLQASVTEGFFSAADARAKDQGTYYAILGTQSYQSGQRSINIVVPKQTTVPYTITVNTDAVAVISYYVSADNVSSKQYLTQKGQGSGTITITQITPTVIGSFSGTLSLKPASGTDTVRTVTGGSFNASF